LTHHLDQVQTNEIPLSSFSVVSHADFMELVDRRDIRPQRPNIDEAPQMTDVLWRLAENCWAKSPTARPNAKVVCDTIFHQFTTVRPIDAIDSPRPCASPTLGPTTIAAGNQDIPGTSGTLQTVNPVGGVQVIEENVRGRH
jgi:hypothetical protein